MSKIILAKSAGFCFGVSRSVKIAEQELKSGKCFSLGPLIHNESVVRNLENQGLLVINSPEEAVPGSRVIIRAHGVSESEIESIKNKGAKVIDATCPYVKKIHEIVEEASKLGKHVIIIGEKEHPEVNGIYGRCNSA
ncbi:MAG: 4-hydroxy-3-methylbut-2-enyl diphosphate reductase, partial [Ruminococcaceae bacterium]|nr:4-hydroxy-3-methylbut-2-enyl diphosphate reductase [Oscillospiraceae bacterium]